MIKEAIAKLVKGENLDFETTKAVMNEIMSGEATEAQMGSFLTALRIKGETIDEITACATVMREKGEHISTNQDVLEIVGTGGDGTGTFNISTTSAFVISAAGVPVAKHGNRSMSSKSGAADCLENLGADLTISPEKCEYILNKCGMCFMFAQSFHKSMKYVGPTRKQIGIRNIFNILGPLTNPAKAQLQVMGVYSEELCEPLAQVLMNLGVKRGVVIYGCDGMDEATVTTKTYCAEIKDGKIETYYITPDELGLGTYEVADLIGGDGKENAQITVDILNGSEKGAKRDAVLLNSGIALYIAGKASDIKGGIALAAETIDSGKALTKKDEFVNLTNE
ncbi:MAG: anthranilate phosphoribosyltransferase [Ruminococcus sp.]|nr:anthranilate phosphoribosyltransferase [Ruminococcus sp.]